MLLTQRLLQRQHATVHFAVFPLMHELVLGGSQTLLLQRRPVGSVLSEMRKFLLQHMLELGQPTGVAALLHAFLRLLQLTLDQRLADLELPARA